MDRLSEKQQESGETVDGLKPEITRQYRIFSLSKNIKTGIVAIFAIIIGGIVIFAGVGLYKHNVGQVQSHKSNEPYPCGNSSAEALSLGCTFDHLTWAWYPPSCPHYANDEFLAAEDWRYYDNPDSKIPVIGETWKKALDNRQDLWGERREHLTHCVYVFLSLGQIIRDGTSFAPRLARYEHLHHCSKILLESFRKDPDWYKIETSVGKASFEEFC